MSFSSLFDRVLGRGVPGKNRKAKRARKQRRAAFRKDLRKDLRLEPLEQRQLLAVDVTWSAVPQMLTFTDNASFPDTLTVDYNSGTDTYTVTTLAGNTFTDSTGGGVPSLAIGGGGTTATFLGAQVASLQIDSDGGADEVYVYGIADPITVNAGLGADKIVVGDAANGLGGIGATVTANGDADPADVLNVKDSLNVVSRTYEVTSTTVGWGGGTQVSYATVESLILDGGSAGDIINVRSSGDDTPITVNADGGDDTVNIGSSGVPGNSLDSILGTVGVSGGAGSSDALVINDQGDTDSNSYTITNTTLNRGGAALISYDTLVRGIDRQCDGLRQQRHDPQHAEYDARDRLWEWRRRHV